MSRGQHQQANNHQKFGSRGARLLSKLGLRYKTVGLRKLETELRAKKASR